MGSKLNLIKKTMKKHKYIIFSASVLLGSLALASFAFADDTSPSPSPTPSPSVRQDKKQERKNKIEDRMQKSKEKADQDKTKMEEKKAKDQDKTQRLVDNIRNFWADMVKKLETLLKNEDRAVSGLSDKLDKAATKGKDVASFRKQLDGVKKLLADARTSLKDAGSKVENILKTETDTKLARQKIMDLEKGIRGQIKTAHQALEDVRKAMKGLGEELKPSKSPSLSPSSSPSTSPTPTATPTR